LVSCGHRCRSRQILGGAKNFCPNFPKLARKVFVRLCLQIFSHKDHEDLFRYELQKKFSCVFQQTLGAIFAQIFDKSKLFGVCFHSLHPLHRGRSTCVKTFIVLNPGETRAVCTVKIQFSHFAYVWFDFPAATVKCTDYIKLTRDLLIIHQTDGWQNLLCFIIAPTVLMVMIFLDDWF